MANEAIDEEKQFQKDLERAQALSLESLALEEFRNRKRLQETHISSYESNKNRSASGIIAQHLVIAKFVLYHAWFQSLAHLQ